MSCALRAPGTHASGRRQLTVAERTLKKSPFPPPCVHTPWSENAGMHSTTFWFVSVERSPLFHTSRMGAQTGHTGLSNWLRRMVWKA